MNGPVELQRLLAATKPTEVRTGGSVGRPLCRFGVLGFRVYRVYRVCVGVVLKFERAVWVYVGF